METKEHPYFPKRRSRLIGVFLVSVFTLFPLAFWLAFNSENLNVIFTALLLLIAVFLGFYFFVAIFMKKWVRCPECSGATRSYVNNNVMYAECSSCMVLWDLGEQYNYD